jgi:hypothetical protein
LYLGRRWTVRRRATGHDGGVGRFACTMTVEELKASLPELQEFFPTAIQQEWSTQEYLKAWLEQRAATWSGLGGEVIARRLHVSRNTVAVVIAQGGQLPKPVRSPQQKIDAQLLQRLYEQCSGWIQRMHEKLADQASAKTKASKAAVATRNRDAARHHPLHTQVEAATPQSRGHRSLVWPQLQLTLNGTTVITQLPSNGISMDYASALVRLRSRSPAFQPTR